MEAQWGGFSRLRTGVIDPRAVNCSDNGAQIRSPMVYPDGSPRVELNWFVFALTPLMVFEIPGDQAFKQFEGGRKTLQTAA